MKQYGITGGIGSGKSLVSKIFTCLGIPVYDADKRGKWLTNNDQRIIDGITALFGEVYVNGSLDRRKVAEAVFGSDHRLQELNAIIHPVVGEDYRNWVLSQESTYVLKEAALLFESGSYKLLDEVIHVSAPVDVRLRRVLKRDPQRTEKEILAIMDRQITDAERLQQSQFEIINDDRTLVIPQVLALHTSFLQEAVGE